MYKVGKLLHTNITRLSGHHISWRGVFWFLCVQQNLNQLYNCCYTRCTLQDVVPARIVLLVTLCLVLINMFNSTTSVSIPHHINILYSFHLIHFIAVVYLNQKVCMYLSKLTSYFYAAPFRCVFDDTKKNRRECSFDVDNLY